jgi:hypothetical protein
MDEKTMNEAAAAPAAGAEQKGTGAADGGLDRLKGVARRHPTAILLVGAGSGLLFGAEFAVGAVLGIGATLLLTKEMAPHVRDQVRRRAMEAYGASARLQERLWRRSKEMLARGHHNGEGAKQAPRIEGDRPLP